MNPEKRDFLSQEGFEEENTNKVENKEAKKEEINLSFASAADLVKQIEEKGYFDGNEYQDTCQYAVIHNKNTGKNDFWDFRREDELEFGEDANKVFVNQLPKYFKEANDENMRVFFCRSKYDIPVMRIGDQVLPLQELAGVENKHLSYWLTPDGVKYQFIHSAKGGIETIIYDNKERVPIDEVQKIGELVMEKRSDFSQRKGLKPFVEFDYDSHKVTQA